MKKIFIGMLLAAGFAACSDGNKNGEQIAYDIQGNWDEGAGQWVRLVSDDFPQAVDSAKVSRLSNTKLEPDVSAVHIRLFDYK